MTIDGPRETQAGRAKRLGVQATAAAGGLVEAVGALADAAVDHVLLTGERVTSAAEGKRALAGGANTEALADRVQRLVALAVPVSRVLIRSARFSRVPWAIIASSTFTTGIAVRTGVRELQVLASLIAHRLEEATGAPSDPALVKKVAIDLYLKPSRTPSLTDDKVRLVRLTRKWLFSGAFGRSTSKRAVKALEAAEKLDARELAARWDRAARD